LLDGFLNARSQKRSSQPPSKQRFISAVHYQGDIRTGKAPGAQASASKCTAPIAPRNKFSSESAILSGDYGQEFCPTTQTDELEPLAQH